MPLDWSPLVDFLRANDDLLLMTHIRPDADGLGSQLALHDALTALGKRSRVVIASKLPPRYHFLDPTGTLIEQFTPATADRFRDAGGVVVLDTGTWGQLGDFAPFMQSLRVPKAVVDHHRTQDDLGGLQLVDTSAEATGRLVYEIVRALGVPLTPRAAHSLFMPWPSTPAGSATRTPPPPPSPWPTSWCGPGPTRRRCTSSCSSARRSPGCGCSGWPWSGSRPAPAATSASPRSTCPTTPPPGRYPATPRS